MQVTRIAFSEKRNSGKYALLEEQARRLGRVRASVWRQYGSIAGVGIRDRAIRDQWMSTGDAQAFGVLANAWKETVRDAVADVAASRESAKVRVRQAIWARTDVEAERKRLYNALRYDRWTSDRWLCRQTRKHWNRGRSRTHNQIVVRSDQFRRWQVQARTVTFAAVHRVVDKAALVVAEDLTKTYVGRKRLGKNTNRRLTGWTKGLTAEALNAVSDRRGSAVRLVNAAYTSQVIPHTRVKQILLERTDRRRSRLPDQDSNTEPRCQCRERNIRTLSNEQLKEAGRISGTA